MKLRDEITLAAFAQQPFEPMPQVEANTIKELEMKLGIKEGNLVKTIERYNHHCDEGRDPDFGKHPSTLTPCRTSPFQAYPVAPARHHTMGGLKVKGTTGRVVDRWGKPIPHFYAAGEVTGGTHGANRLGHNATPDCIIFGRTVGRLAAMEKE